MRLPGPSLAQQPQSNASGAACLQVLNQRRQIKKAKELQMIGSFNVDADADMGNSDDLGRAGATGEDAFPDSRKGQLDGNFLEKLRSTKAALSPGPLAPAQPKNVGP